LEPSTLVITHRKDKGHWRNDVGGKIVKIPPHGPAFMKLTELVKEMSGKAK